MSWPDLAAYVHRRPGLALWMGGIGYVDPRQTWALLALVAVLLVA